MKKLTTDKDGWFFQRRHRAKYKVPAANLLHVFNDEWKPLCNE